MKPEAKNWLESAMEDLGFAQFNFNHGKMRPAVFFSQQAAEKAQIIGKLNEFKGAIRKEYAVEKIVFFGSRATGNYRKNSDIDLILVSKKFKGKSFLKRPIGLHHYWNLDYPVDFICYTPEEFNKLKAQITLVREAVKEGIEI